MAKKQRVTDAMRIAALAAEVGRLKRPRISLQMRVWEEGFTVGVYQSGRCIAHSDEPHDDVERALREALANLFTGPSDAR